MSVLGDFDWLIFHLRGGYIFLHLCMFSNHWPDARHSEFYLLEARYFCIPVNTELYSRMQFNYVILLVLLLRLVGAPFSLGLTMPHFLGRTLLIMLLSAPWVLRFSSLAGKNWHCFQMFMVAKYTLLQFFQMVLCMASGHFLRHTCANPVLWWILKGVSLHTSRIFFLYSFLLSVILSRNSSHVFLHRFSALSLPDSSLFFSPCLVAWKLSRK